MSVVNAGSSARNRPLRRGNDLAVRLTQSALDDFDAILDWTAHHFGDFQADRYAGLIASTIDDLGAGPELAGVRQRPEHGTQVHALPLGRSGQAASHSLWIRCNAEPQTLDILRILHDGQAPDRHLPD